MSRPLNRKMSWYKVYIKELGTPNILKSECEEKCDYVYVKAYTGDIALSLVQNHIRVNDEKYRPVYYHRMYGGVESIERSKKVFFKE